MTEFSGARSLRERVDMVAESLNQTIAITFSENCDSPETQITFRSFAVDVRNRTSALLRSGVAPGDVIAAFMPLTPVSYQTLLAAMVVGTVAPLNYLLEAEALIDLLRQVKASVLLTSATAAEDPTFPGKVAIIRNALPDVKVVVFGDAQIAPGTVELDALMSETGEDWPDGLPNDTCRNMVLMLTGGTTGKPKIVPHTEAMYLALLEAGAHAQGALKGERMLSALPLFHTSGTLNAGLIPLMAGASIFIPSARGYRDPDVAKRFWELVERYRITLGAAVPTALAAIASNPPTGPVSGFKHILTGGAPLPQATAEAIRESTGAFVVNGWGMTETCGFSVLNPVDNPRIETVGVPFDCIQAEVRLPAADGNLTVQAGTDQIGELVVRGATVITHYLDDYPDAFTPDRWLRTGDLARIDANGHLTITGRQKDIIIRGGHNIDPEIIEGPAYRHPAVELAAAVGRPDSYAGEVPILFVQLKPDVRLEENELLEFVRPLIVERAAIPKSVHILGVMPLSGPGKISKLILRREAARQVFQHEADAIAGSGKIAVSVHDDARHGIVAELREVNEIPDSVRKDIDEKLKQYSIAARWAEGVTS